MESPNGFSIEGGKTLNRNCNSIWVSKALFYECQSLMKAKRDESTVQSPGLDARWKDHEEPWDKVVLLCNSLRYLSTVLVFYVLHQEIEPCVTDINPAPIKIRSHNTLRQHIYWHSWQFLSPGDAKRQQQEPLQRRLAFLFIGINTDLWPTWKAVLTHKMGRQPPFLYHRMPRKKVRICL